MPGEKSNTHERIIDAAEEVPRGVALLRMAVVLLVWALLAGVAVGVGCLATLKVVDLLQEAVWDGLAESLPQPLGAVAPMLLCTLGGVLVGVATSRAGFSLDTLDVVVGRCRTEGGYQVKSWPWALLLFALPIAFGGAVGPEAGVSGFTAALGTMAMHGMRRSGVAAARNASHPLVAAWKALSPAASDEGRRYSRRPRALLWAMAAVGFVLGALGVSHLFGPGAGFPRFGAIDYLGLGTNALWALLALPLGWVLARIAAYAGKAAKLACGRMKTVPKAILCGVVLGLVAMALPEVLFSGQSGTAVLLGSWQAMSAGVLLATCVAKLALTQLCEETGWVGGEFFPNIFCGVAAGYAVAAITGGDPMLAVALSTGALVGAATRKWLLSTCVLALSFPPASLPVVALAAFLGAKASGHSRS